MPRVSVTFNKLTKVFLKPETFNDLVDLTEKHFGSLNIPTANKFFYTDEEGDIISITCQEDYEGAFEIENSILVLIVEQSSAAAKFIMPLIKDLSLRDNEDAFGMSAQSVVFEEVQPESVIQS
jgi:hypothetical protein